MTEKIARRTRCACAGWLLGVSVGQAISAPTWHNVITVTVAVALCVLCPLYPLDYEGAGPTPQEEQ